MSVIGVTGSNGFIGGYVLEELRAQGYDTFGLDHSLKDFANDPDEIMIGDIRDHTAVSEFVAHVDGVIHLAGCLGTAETIQDPWPATETNVQGGLNVLQACSKYNVPLVNIGVGNFFENNTYSLTKNTVERFVLMYQKYRQTRAITVRALNAYGPRQSVAQPWGSSKVRKAIPSFVHRALAGLPIEVYGDGSQIMDFIYVSDVAATLVAGLQSITRQPWEHDFIPEAGTGRRTSIKAIAELTAEAVAVYTGKPQVEVRHLPLRPGETPGVEVLADTRSLEPLWEDGIHPDDFKRFEVGILNTVEYYGEKFKA